jgi:hypothetical protein
MPGGFTPVNGTAAATNKVWMTSVADKYTLLAPYEDAGGANPYFQSTFNSVLACHFVNQMNVLNASFGAFTTAPDGTNTAQKLVEDNTTNQHMAQAGFQFFGTVQPRIRIANIWKAGNLPGDRTRICYQTTSSPFGSPLGDVAYCGFDLAGGQIAYGFTSVGLGSTYFLYENQTIIGLGGGWFLCYVDVQNLVAGGGDGQKNGGLNFRFILDNGAGTAAPSLSYTGNGTSGLFGWRSSCLPRQAWNLSHVTFFDDFNDPTMANIDLNNTQAPGFDWYVQSGCWPNWYQATPVPLGKLSASGSILHMRPLPSVSGTQHGGGLTTFCQPGPGNITNNGVPPGAGVGTGWKMPFMLEFSWAYDYPNVINGGDGSFWMASAEFTDLLSLQRKYNNGDPSYIEVDPAEPFNIFGPGSGLGPGMQGPQIGNNPANNDAFGGVIASTTGYGLTWWGYPAVQSGFLSGGHNNYPGNAGVSSGGSYYYQSDNNAVTLPSPPAAPWVAFTYPTTFSSVPVAPISPTFMTDFSQQNIYTNMFFPYDPVTGDRGCWIQFFNGVFRCCLVSWTPNPTPSDNSNRVMQITQNQRLFLQFNFSQSGTGFDMYSDFVRITQ